MRVTLFRARWILPVATPPIADGAVLVGEDGRIAAVGPAAALDLPPDAELVELGESILLPGLVNVHAHPELAMFRGYLEDLPFREWILRLVGAKRSVLTEEDALAAARWTVAEALRCGITTLAATEQSAAALPALVEAGMRGIVYQEVFGPDPLQAFASIRDVRDAITRLRERATDLVAIGVSPHAPYTVSDNLYRATAAFAREEDLPMALHLAESVAERDLVTRGGGDFAPGLQARGIATPPRGRSPVELVHRLGMLDQAPLLIHCVDVDDADIEAIAGTGCAIAHCPVANAKLGHGVAPLLRLREAGVRVGLGTDSVGSNNRMDLLEEARIGALLQRGIARRHDLLNSEDLLRLCTIEGARALDLDDRIGSLEPGKCADLCAVKIGSIHTTPSFDPVATLFHAARGTDVVLTVVAGRILFHEGRFLSLDPESARQGIESAAERLAGAR
jgi:cytosine/adenosine deaminase-related metal-dependent hydrolase